MPVSWGSRFIAVTAENPFDCHVHMVDLRPHPLREELYMPVCEDSGLQQYESYTNEVVAVARVKEHIFRITRIPIMELATSLTDTAMKKEETRWSRPDGWQAMLTELVAIETRTKGELKKLKALRRAKVSVV